MDNKETLRDRLTIQKLGKQHLAQFNNLLRYAFQITNQDLVKVGWDNDEIKQSKSPVLKHADVLGWFDEDKLASQIAVYPMQVNIHGTIFTMGGVTGVATYPEYASLGLMHGLMKRSLEEMREKRQTISFLYPYSIPFYRRKGWEIISDKMTFTIKDTQLPKRVNVPGRVERVEINHVDLYALYHQFALNCHGALLRDALAWEEYWRWDVEDMIVAIYYDVHHEPTGYVAYFLENDVFKIKEIVHLNEEARHGLWNYIAAHFSMVTEVTGNNFTGESLAFLLEDGEIKETIRPYYMARIVDVMGFFAAYFSSIQLKEQAITFEVTDSMLEWNHGIFSVAWDAEGVLTVGRTRAGEAVALDIQTLVTMLLGYRRPLYLKRIERLQASQAAIKWLEKIIPMEQPCFSDYF